jgi:2-polyprenyl-6-methoxyphenol hydroxylase-like FAD-dependent oxidoreductase
MRILIIGGGIGGLATAIGLRLHGHEPIVFEQASQLREVGAGVSLWPNALRAADHLGIGDAIHQQAVSEGQGGMRSWDGMLLSEMDIEEFRATLGDVTVVLHRAELLALLHQALGDVPVTLSARCLTVTQDEQGVVAHFADGTQAQGDLLIGADGLRSKVRESLFGFAPPTYSGYTGWRAIIEFEHTKLTAGISIGRGAQVGQVPMSHNRVYWFATQNLPEGEAPLPGGDKQGLLDIFHDWHAPIPELIATIDEDALLRDDIYDRTPIREWGRERVTLLGDAAHPMTPNMGQGACQALEDAVVLTHCVGSIDDSIQALRAYEQRRMKRANTIVRQSRLLGRILQLNNTPLCWMRDAVFGSASFARMQIGQLQKTLAFEL